MKPNNYRNFDSAFLKLERAKVHANELDKAVKEFLGKSPYQLITSNSGNRKTVRVEQVMDVPDEIPLLLGDFVHNCRSSLDHLAADLVLAKGGSVADLHFPTSINKERFHKVLTAEKSKIKQAGPEVITKLAEAEIYRGGKGYPIRGLHELDIADKHMMLIPNVSRVTLTNIETDGLKQASLTINIQKGYTNLILAEDIKTLTFDEEVVFGIEISESECFRGQLLSEAVESMFNSTYSLVKSFKDDKQFPRRKISV